MLCIPMPTQVDFLMEGLVLGLTILSAVLKRHECQLMAFWNLEVFMKSLLYMLPVLGIQNLSTATYRARGNMGRIKSKFILHGYLYQQNLIVVYLCSRKREKVWRLYSHYYQILALDSSK